MSTDFEKEHEAIFKQLRSNESGEVTVDELSQFLNELLKNQIKVLRSRLEYQKYERCMETENDGTQGKKSSAKEKGE